MAQGRRRRGQQQGAGAGGLQPEQGPLDRGAAGLRHRRLLAPRLQQHRALGQATSRLLERLHHQISTTGQTSLRQARIQAQMGTVGLIQQHGQPSAMHRSDQAREICCQALIAGGHQHHRRQGPSSQGRIQMPGQRLGCGWHPQPGSSIKRKIEEHWPQLSEHAAMQQGAMQIAGQQHPITRLGQSQQRHLQQPTGPIDPEPAALSAEQRGGGGLGLRHGSLHLQRATDLRQLRQVPAARWLAQQAPQLRGQRAAPAVGRKMQGQWGRPRQQALQQSHGPSGVLPRV